MMKIYSEHRCRKYRRVPSLLKAKAFQNIAHNERENIGVIIQL